MKVYAKDLKVGNITELNGRVERVSGDAEEVSVSFTGRGVGYLFEGHDVVTLTRL